MIRTGRDTEPCELWIDVADECETPDHYEVQYEIYDDAARTGIIRYRSDYRIVSATRNDNPIAPASLDAWPRDRITAAILSKHGPAISGI